MRSFAVIVFDLTLPCRPRAPFLRPRFLGSLGQFIASKAGVCGECVIRPWRLEHMVAFAAKRWRLQMILTEHYQRPSSIAAMRMSQALRGIATSASEQPVTGRR